MNDPKRKFATRLLMLVAFGAPALASAAQLRPPLSRGNVPGTADLSVMTYNVEGLPWPIRWGRDKSISMIGAHLARLRRQGTQPHVVALQEAFTAEARRIGVAGGYRYVAFGPDRNAVGAAARRSGDIRFQSGASFWKGEWSGRALGSGLEILSDYPIRSLRRQPFPTYACAGFDCLANKGMVMAMIAVPGAADPVAIVDVHLNSRRASGVAPVRSDYAFRRQVDAIGGFLKANVPAGIPLIVAGDFNIGRAADRRAYFDRQSAIWQMGRTSRIKEALSECTGQPPSDGETPGHGLSLRREKDRQFILAGTRTQFDITRISVPFSYDQYREMLSDHLGYIAHYVRRTG